MYPPGTKPTEMRPESVRVLGLLRTVVHEGGTLGERKPKREALRVALSRAITSAGATARASFTLSVLMTVRSDLVFCYLWASLVWTCLGIRALGPTVSKAVFAAIRHSEHVITAGPKAERATHGGNAGHNQAQGWPLDGRPHIAHVRQSGLVRAQHVAVS